MELGKRVVRREAGWWRVEFKEVVMRVLGSLGFSVENRVGNFAARAEGLRSRCVLVVEWRGEVARSVAVRGVFLLEEGDGEVWEGSLSLAVSIILSWSSSDSSSSTSEDSSSAFFALTSSSSFCRFSRSTSTDNPRPSPVSLSTASQTLFLSIVNGIFCFSLFSRRDGSLSSSRLLRNRSSRLVLSRTFFLVMCRD